MKKNTKILTFVVFLSIFIILIYVYFFNKNRDFVYAISNVEEKNDEIINFSNSQKININEIIEENTSKNYKEEIVTEEIEMEYTTCYKNNSELPKEMIQVVQEGRTGVQEVVVKKIYSGEELVSEVQISTQIKKKAVTKIVEIGTGKYKNNHKIKIGDTLYVTSDRLNVMSEKSLESRKITALSKNSEIILLDINDDWYYISIDTIKGWVKSESVTYFDPNKSYEEQIIGQGISKSDALANLSMNMDLTKPSGFSLEQFKQVLSDSKDKNGILEANSEFFYYAEQQYGINGIFLASIGIHESAWGTSAISLRKKNLFGYGAYDSSPSSSAYSFDEYSSGIDLVARVLVKYYLNPYGTMIYGGEKASGKYYNGNTITAVNKRYATDTNWKNCVYKYMQYLYNKL